MPKRNKSELAEMYRALESKLGEPFGQAVFCRETGVKASEISYYWPSFGKFVDEMGGRRKSFTERLPDEIVFQDYAQICLHLSKIPTFQELRILTRELSTRTHTVYTRDGNISAFRSKFRSWLSSASDDLKVILTFEGWGDDLTSKLEIEDGPNSPAQPQLRPYLPACLQYLEALARGDLPPFESQDISPALLFERRVSDAFRCLGFEMRQFGQGTGRKSDCLACSPTGKFALIIDAKTRAGTYKLGTEDRKFLEYSMTHGKHLQAEGFDKLYLVLVSGSFRNADLKQLSDFLFDSPIRGVCMLSAQALVRIVEDSIRNRSKFSLLDFAKSISGNKIISE